MTAPDILSARIPGGAAADADLAGARAALPGHTIALCRGEQILTSDLSGVAPMLAFLDEGRDLSGFAVADRVVGRAAAMLFVYAGIRTVYADLLSDGGAAYLRAHGIPFCAKACTPFIRNRAGTGQCPMESAVEPLSDSDDPSRGVAAIRAAIARLRAGHPPVAQA